MAKLKSSEGKIIWANLIHLSYNMWADRDISYVAETSGETGLEDIQSAPYLRFDTGLWNDLLKQMVKAGINLVVIDLGDGVKYESHPEIAVKGAWTTKRLRTELKKMRSMGLEPIPKLNFSACHDDWLGPYSRCLSTDTYYRVCKDLIAEVLQLFSKPRFFHLGMDEEGAVHQRFWEYVVVRQFDLWWHDLYFLVEQVEKGGARAWVWSDYAWDNWDNPNPKAFFSKMPKSVVQSNWYYGDSFNRRHYVDSRRIKYVQTYFDLEAHGYDQIPTGSTWGSAVNFGKTVRYCRRNISPRHLLGFLQTTWRMTTEKYRDQHEQAIQLVGEAVAGWNR